MTLYSNAIFFVNIARFIFCYTYCILLIINMFSLAFDTIEINLTKYYFADMLSHS